MSAPSSSERSVGSETSSHTLHSAGANEESETGRRRQRTRGTGAGGGGFLVDAGVAVAMDRHGDGRAGHLSDRKGKTRRVEEDEGDEGDERLRVPKTRTTATGHVDASQLVHMALSLSENRRRTASAAPLLSSPSRAPSGAVGGGRGGRDGSFSQARVASFSNARVASSLRQYLDDQRRASRNLSPRATPDPSRAPVIARLNPSSATLARRDRARAYLELRAAYMRLLAVLPPLRADASALANYTFASTVVPGSPVAYLTRTPSHAHARHPLGRPYNPIQALRNRRSRARERLALPLDPAAFSDVDRVLAWVDETEAHANRPHFRLDDRVALPPLLLLPHDDDRIPQKPAKPPVQGWSFTPEELLADAYWLEHPASKSVIEDRHGRKIFPPREPKPDVPAPRPSKDSIDAVSATDPGTADESDPPASQPARKRRLLPKIRADSRRRRASPAKHDSDSSDTDHHDIEYNTGPLALQMKRQLELQTQGLANKTPALDTPDTPNKWGRHDVSDGQISRPRTTHLTPIKSAEPRSSLEDDSTGPSRASSERARSKRTKLNPFHPAHDQHDQKDDAEPRLGNALLAAPSAVKNLLGHRKNESVSSLTTPDKLRRRDAQDPHSAVTRFFKGVKHEGTKVGGIIFRRDRADDTDASTVSDHNSVDFDDDTHPTPLSRTLTSTSAASDNDARTHLQLPSFRPVNDVLSDNDTSDPEHHISRQSRQRRNDRSPRIDRLLPPRMDLERVPTASSTATVGPDGGREPDLMQKQLARPGGVPSFPNNLPPTALKNARNRHRSASRPTLDSKRHWSITDSDHQPRRVRNAVSQADIARVRALFLCSGVKAKEIARRAYTPRNPAPSFLTHAAATANQQLFTVPRKEEHVLAARILVNDLARRTSALQHACDAFRTGTIDDLNARITRLRSAIESDLMPRVFEAGDRAITVTSEVSGQGPLSVKQINDEIDRMLRQRRRHSRWLMSWAWSAVEWGIVVALRLASVVFALYGLLKGGVGVLLGVVRWLLWL